MNTKDQPAQASGDRIYVLRKRGFFYRVNNMGYTSEIQDAHRYTKEEAETQKNGRPEVTIHLASDYAPAQASGDSDEAVRQHLSWLRTYTCIMEEHNWKDMRLHIARTVEQLDAALRHSVQAEGVGDLAEKLFAEMCPGIPYLAEDRDWYEDLARAVTKLSPTPATPDHAAVVEAYETAAKIAHDEAANWISWDGKQCAQTIAAAIRRAAALSTGSPSETTSSSQCKLVPVEPTKEQVQAGLNATLEHFDFIQPGVAEAVYRAMVAATPSSRAVAWPTVSIKRMPLSDGRTDYFVSIQCGDREVTPHVFREEYKAAYHVALYSWLLNGTNKPDLVAFNPEDWPALSAAPLSSRAEVVEAWRPIDTAPKDNTRVLVCDAQGNRHIVSWSTQWSDLLRAESTRWWAFRNLPIEPVIWMPLPEARAAIRALAQPAVGRDGTTTSEAAERIISK